MNTVIQVARNSCFFRIYQNGVFIKQVSASTTSFMIKDVTKKLTVYAIQIVNSSGQIVYSSTVVIK